MIRVPHRSLPRQTVNALKKEQDAIDKLLTYPERIAKAKSSWSNISRRKMFDMIKGTLREMCPGIQRCMYCEDSGANDIEHFKPIALYPEVTFVWENYLYACSGCNRIKGDRFAIFDVAGQVIDVTRKTDEPPQPGKSVFINPREEDGMNFLELQLLSNFEFEPMPGLSASDKERAKYTRDKLGLNRDMLLRARHNIYKGNRVFLKAYIDARDNGASNDELQRIISLIQANRHPTVWLEMQRQQQRIAELQPLFDAAPEALTW